MSNPCTKSPHKGACAGLFCPEDRTYLGLTVQKDVLRVARFGSTFREIWQ